MSEKSVKPQSSLAKRLGITLVFVLMFSVGLSALLSYFNFEKKHQQLVSSRLQVMLDEVRVAIDQGTSLGLPLESQTEISNHLHNLTLTDTSIHIAAVMNMAQSALFSVGDVEQVTAHIPAQWYQAHADNQSSHALEIESYLLVAEPILNNFDRQTGLLILAYDKQAYIQKNQQLLTALNYQTLLSILAGGVVGLLLLMLLMRRMNKMIQRLNLALKQNLSGRGQDYALDENSDHLEYQYQPLHQQIRDLSPVSRPIPEEKKQ